MSSSRMTQNLIGAGFLSPTGASKAFDADADGYCRAEGAGLVVLKPLSDAMQHGDHILGVITGIAVNQGSNCSPIFVPDGQSQHILYDKVLAKSGIRPADVTYVVRISQYCGSKIQGLTHMVQIRNHMVPVPKSETPSSSKASEKHLVDPTGMIKSSLAPSKIISATLKHLQESRQ